MVGQSNTLDSEVRPCFVGIALADYALTSSVRDVGEAVIEVGGVREYGVDDDFSGGIDESIFAVYAYPCLAFRKVSGSRAFLGKLTAVVPFGRIYLSRPLEVWTRATPSWKADTFV